MMQWYFGWLVIIVNGSILKRQLAAAEIEGMVRIIGVYMVGMVRKHVTFFGTWHSIDSTTLRLFQHHIGSSGRGQTKQTLQIYW